jgi:CBS-domain-containing membrane protein
LLLKRTKQEQGEAMKGFHPLMRPETFREKLDAMAHWAFVGLLLGGLAYLLIWQLIIPIGDMAGYEYALLLFWQSPLGWMFPLLTMLGMSLVPAVAAKSDAEHYGRDAAFLATRWVILFAILTALTVWAARHFSWRQEMIPFVLLLLPLPPTGVVLLGPVRKRMASDGF